MEELGTLEVVAVSRRHCYFPTPPHENLILVSSDFEPFTSHSSDESAYSADILEDFHLLENERVVRIERNRAGAPQTPRQLGEALTALFPNGSAQRLPLAAAIENTTARTAKLASEFARDSLIMAMFTPESMPNLTLATLRRLAEHQGVYDAPLCLDNPRFDAEEIGKIPHEIRDANSSIARTLSAVFGWEWPYFGSLDATPMFVSLLAQKGLANPEIMRETVVQRDGITRTLGQVFLRALDWMINAIDRHPLGLLGTYAASDGGWQVSRDCIDGLHRADGSLARGFVAPFAAQIFAYDALLYSAELIDKLRVFDFAQILADEASQFEDVKDIMGRPISTAKLMTLRLIADQLRFATLQTMWIDRHGGFFAAGYQLDATYTGPLDIKTSDMGLALNSRLLDGDAMTKMRAAIVQQLTDDQSPLVCPNGIRSLASDEVRFRASSAHNGAVRPWMNAWIAAGLRRHHFERDASRLEARTLRLVQSVGCYPEFVRGTDNSDVVLNDATIYTVAPNGYNEYFENPVIEPPATLSGCTAFAVWSIIDRT